MKILLITHNPVNTFQNMGKTFMSLFSSFSKSELCQLYIYPSLPDVDFCESYYRITDKDVLKSYYRFHVYGKEIQKSEISTSTHKLFENQKDEKLYRNRKNKNANRLLFRDLLWKFSPWYNTSLKNWIKRQKPTCIFVAPGTSKFLYDVALKISKKFSLPIVTYFCDDYYFIKKSKSLLGYIQQFLLKKKIQKLAKQSKKMIVICDQLKDLYESEFNVPAITIMTGSNLLPKNETVKNERVKTITYIGNINCKRYLSLCSIGKALEQLNKERDIEIQLKIYTSESDKQVIDSFNGISSIKFCGFVSGESFFKALYESDFLLHVEAFDEKSIDRVKHSVSTKIADCLACGICLIAYGPHEVASIQHLIKNKCALVCLSENDLKKFLNQCFLDDQLREKTIKNALKTAQEYHNSAINSKKLYETIIHL